MKWEISKEFDFCYGHRVWSQTLNIDFSLDACLKCRHLHGHQGKVIVYLESNELNNSMVTDFKHLNWFKKFFWYKMFTLFRFPYFIDIIIRDFPFLFILLQNL